MGTRKVEKIRRHAAVVTGNFPSIFEHMVIQPLPAAVTRLITEINRPEPDIDRLMELISSDREIASMVIKTVNSSLFGLRKTVNSVKHAVTLLGLHNIQSLALAYATMDALPRPKGGILVQKVFWAESLLRAMLSRSFSKKSFGTQMEEAFTASLMADLGLPVLLSAWGEDYQPVIEEWKQSPERLTDLERKHLGWDHAQAGAWLVRSWGFPEEMVGYIGAHNLSWEKIREFELEDTIVTPIAAAALTPSVLKPDLKRSESVLDAAIEWLSFTSSEYIDIVNEVRKSLRETLELFGLLDYDGDVIIDYLLAAASSENHHPSPLPP